MVLAVRSVAAERRDGQLLAHLEGAAGTLVAFGADGKAILTAGGGEARVWDASTFKPTTERLRHGEPIRTAALSPDGATVLTAGGKQVRLWDAVTGRQLHALGHEDVVLDADFGPDGGRVLTAGRDKTARVWDANTGRLLLTLQHPAAVGLAAFSRDGSKVLTLTVANRAEGRGADRDWMAAARVWDANTGRELYRRQVGPWAGGVPDRRHRPAAFSRDGRRVATASFNFVDVWDARTGKSVMSVNTSDASGAETRVVAFSPDGARVLAACTGTVLWDVATGKPAAGQRPPGSFTGMADVAFSPDGRRMLLSAQPPYAGLWDLASGKQILAFKGGDGTEEPAVAYSADGRRVAAGYGSKNYTDVWAVGPGWGGDG